MTGGLVFAAAPPAHADPVVLQPGELVVNGGAEQAASVGWTGVLGRATHGVSSYPTSVIVNSAGATGATFPGGNALFTGDRAASSVATQTINLAPSAAAIDNGHVDASLSAYVGGYAAQRDNATLIYDFEDAAGANLATVSFGPVLVTDRGSVSGFVPFAATQLLPTGTRQVVITIKTQRFTAPANDGYVDNVSLVLDAPSPVASPDDTTTDQGVPVTVDVLGNDTPGAGAAFVPSSVRLLNGATEVTSLTNADGIYQANTTTGAVVFTPSPGFIGTTTAVPYRVTDSSGQRADSTVVIHVTFVAVPALTLVKSASPSNAAAFTEGTEITYSFVVTNTGNVTMNDIAIDEVSFSGENSMSTPVCPEPSLDPGEQEICAATYTLTSADVDSGGVANTATATGVAQGSVATTTSSPSSFSVPIAADPSITLAKSVAPATANHAGDTLGYSFLVTNTGNVSVHTVTIAEGTFSGTGGTPAASCPSGSLLPGQTITCAATYQVTQADVDAGSITNTATAAATPAGGGTVSSASSSAIITLTPQPTLVFEKTADRSTVTTAGQLVTYSFAVTNTGNVTLSQVTVNDSAFTGAGTLGPISCPSSPTTLAPGKILTCTAEYTTAAADLLNQTISNTATAGVRVPSGATITSDPSTSTIAVAPAGPASGGDPVLAVTGVDASSAATLGLLLALGGLVFLAVTTIWPRRRRG
jgi:uncharacterized repeat protein (TIGR01451 family)